MEPRSTIAEIDKKSGRLMLHMQSQTPGSTRDIGESPGSGLDASHRPGTTV
jgi:hypothetical protein